MISETVAAAETRSILHPFGLAPSADPKHVFESALIYAARDIRELYLVSDYDHRSESPESERQYPFVQTEQFRRGYAAFKFSVARVLQPRTICEIGIGSGVAARAFMAGAPSASYIGIDDGSKDRDDDVHLIQYTRDLFHKAKRKCEIRIADSMTIHSAPKVDLFHVDGGHDLEHASNDTKLAMESGSEWILIDDARDPTVIAGAMMAAYMARVMFHWAYFEDTWTGSVLIHRVGG